MPDRLDHYNVTWDSPSKDSSGSMPLGNGDVGVNVWVEESGDIVLLLAKTDAWDENASLLKLGRVRLKITPNPIDQGKSFRQTLRLRTADIEIIAGAISLRIWVDANHPVIRIEANGDSPFTIQAALETWRTKPYAIKTQTSDLFKSLAGKNADPFPTIVSPDHILPVKDNRIVWCHHNGPRENDGYAINMKLQGLDALLNKMPHPLLGRTFGASMGGEDFVAIDPTTLQSESPAKGHRLSIVVTTEHPSSIPAWQNKLEETAKRIEAIDDSFARREHERWWDEFWNRSWIYVTSPDPNEQASAFHVTQSYLLQRFMNATAGRGTSPIKHNGSIFSVGKPDDPDFRRWGGPGYWFMNQRLIYWPMLAAGDFDLMRAWLAMYRAMLPLQQHRTRTYFDHGGAHYPETVMFWGAEVSAHYGWTPFGQRSHPEAETPYLKYYLSGGIELVLMMCEYVHHTGDETFARSELLPVADAVIEFFDLHYPRDANGKIRFEPAQSLETWHEAVNPLPEIAGLQYTIARLLELPPHWIGDAQRQRWSRLQSELPPLPIGKKEGKRVILPAEQFDKKKNTENPELYCVFPYRLFSVGAADLELARDTFAARLHVSHECWSQDEIQMALLGLPQQAKESLRRRAAPASHSDSRFPAFWNAFHDWIPDIDHGGVLQMALQLMLVQSADQQLLLLPAWPKEWDADFKLHAPDRTIVEGSVRNGEMVELKINTPGVREDGLVVE